MKRILFLSLVVFLTFFSVYTQQKLVKNKQSNLSNKIENLNGKEVRAGTVLLKFKDNISKEQENQILQELAGITSRFSKPLGIYIVTSDSLSTKELLEFFSKKTEVEIVEPDKRMKLNKIPNDSQFSSLWSFWNLGQNIQGQYGVSGIDIKAKNAWNITTGNKQNVVAIVDSGISYSHPDLDDNIWSAPVEFTVDIGGQSLTCPAGTHGIDIVNLNCYPIDDNNHGTHVAGIIGGEGNNGEGVTGVNWNANILSLKVFADDDTGFVADALFGISCAYQLKETLGNQANIRVVNNSYGFEDFDAMFLTVINQLNASNVLFVASAGNGGIFGGTNNDNTPTYPANFQVPNVISVSSINNSGGIAYTSNYGPNTVHLGSPGVDILSTVRNNTYQYLSGTSQAAPQVSGAALLILSKCNIDTPTLKSIILNNTDSTSSLIGKTVTGGRLNVYKALKTCAPEPNGDGYNTTIIYPYGYPPGFADAQVGDINEKGQIAGYTTTSISNDIRLFTYDKLSGMEVLSPITASLSYQPRSINESGSITGGDENLGYNGFFHTPQSGIQTFGTITGGYDITNGNAINDTGTIVGQTRTSSNYDNRKPFVRHPNGEMEIIQPLGNLVGSAIDVNNNGTALVWNTISGNPNYYLYDINDETVTNLPSVSGYIQLVPLKINNNGLVIGITAPTAGGQQVGFFYHPSSGVQIISSALGGVQFIDVNDRGEAIGYIDRTALPRRYFTYDSANGFQFIDSVNGFNLQNLYSFVSINNKGQILARGQVGGPNAYGGLIFSPSHTTPTGSNVSVYTGSVAVSYSNVQSSGQTVVGPIPLPPTATLPANYLLTGSSLAYDVETTASYSGSNRVCFTLTTISDEATFSRMKLLHFENGSFIDRTISRDYSTLEICAEVTSFSPFVTALAPLAPTAANVQISGRVLLPNQTAISRAKIQLVGNNGSFVATSNSFGYFRFDNVPAGQTYVIQANHKRYTFSPQVLNVLEEISNLDLIALEEN